MTTQLGHINNNPRFNGFREAVESRGFTLRIIFSASDGIYVMAVVGEGDVAHRTIVVRDYGGDSGFGVWLESRTGNYADGAEEIITMDEHKLDMLILALGIGAVELREGE